MIDAVQVGIIVTFVRIVRCRQAHTSSSTTSPIQQDRQRRGPRMQPSLVTRLLWYSL